MKLLDYQLLHELPELPAASSIACLEGQAFLIGDSSQFLHVVAADGQRRRFSLLPEADVAQEPLRKKRKPDFEGLILDASRRQLLVLPSGSRKNRFVGVMVDLARADCPGASVDLLPLYQRVMQAAGLDEDDLNIEGGGLLEPHRWFLLNRGNGPKRQNLVIIVEGEALWAARPVGCHRLPLPELDGVPATSTDGFAHDGWLYVLAAAEGTTSTFDDGEVAGSLIARFSLGDFSPHGWCRLPADIKMEGLALCEMQEQSMNLLLCSDLDDPEKPGRIYRATLELA